MMELYISSKVKSHTKLRERAENNHIALRIIEEKNRETATLMEGTKAHEGVDAINNFFDHFESFMWNWNAPKRDNHDFI